MEKFVLGPIGQIGDGACTIFCAVPRPPQTVPSRRSRQKTTAHVGGNNLDVVSHVSRVLEGLNGPR